MKISFVNLVEQHSSLKNQILRAVEKVLDHGNFILGEDLAHFEKGMAKYLGVSSVVGVNSGLDALVFALRLHKVGPGDEVITVSHSFLATGAAIVLLGAKPVFVDVDEDTYVINSNAIESSITERTKAIIPVHLCGYPADLKPILNLCKAKNLALIEDCAQAIGTIYDGRKAGSFGTGCFSVHPLKILNALGDGGFLSVNNSENERAIRLARNHGLLDRDTCVEVGYNSRLDTLQAAILNVKMQYLEQWIADRQKIAERYSAILSRYVHVPPDPKNGRRHVYSAFVITTEKRNELAAFLKEKGIDVRIHYPIPMHLQKPYLEMGYKKGMLPVTEKLADTILSLPIYSGLSEESQDYVINSIVDYFR